MVSTGVRNDVVGGVLVDRRGALAVAVVDRAQTYRGALVSALRKAGYGAEAPDEPVAWPRRPGPRATLLAVRRGLDWEMLDGLRGPGTHHFTVALLEDASPHAWGEALRLGARTAADWNEHPSHIVRVLAAAAEDLVLLPGPIAQGLACGTSIPPPGKVNDEQIKILRLLAKNLHVLDIAAALHCSERTTDRKIKKLYKSIGVENRIEAVLQAERWGLLRDV